MCAEGDNYVREACEQDYISSDAVDAVLLLVPYISIRSVVWEHDLLIGLHVAPARDQALRCVCAMWHVRCPHDAALL